MNMADEHIDEYTVGYLDTDDPESVPWGCSPGSEYCFFTCRNCKSCAIRDGALKQTLEEAK